MYRAFVLIFILILTACSSDQNTKEIYSSKGNTNPDTSSTSTKENYYYNLNIQNARNNYRLSSAQLNKGYLKYSIDTQMIIGHYYTVNLSINKGDSISDKSTEKKEIKISNVVEAELISKKENNFQIKSLNNQKQFIDQGETNWSWSIKPLSHGKQSLLIKLSVLNAQNNRKNIVFKKEVNVSLKPQQMYYICHELPKKNKNKKEIKIKYLISKTKIKENSDSFKTRIPFKLKILSSNNNFYLQPQETYIKESISSFTTTLTFEEYSTVQGNISIWIEDNFGNTQKIHTQKMKRKVTLWAKIKNFFNQNIRLISWLSSTLLIPLFLYIRKRILRYFKYKRLINSCEYYIKNKDNKINYTDLEVNVLTPISKLEKGMYLHELNKKCALLEEELAEYKDMKDFELNSSIRSRLQSLVQYYKKHKLKILLFN